MPKRTVLSNGVFSASAITSAETCEVKAYNEYEEGWQLKKISNGLKTGLMMHDAQEMYIKGDNESAVINSIEEEVKSLGWDEDELFLPKLRAYIKGYYERWEVEDADTFSQKKYELISTEEDFEFTSSHITFVGRMDAVLLDKENDHIILMEHKNVSPMSRCKDMTSFFWRSLVFNNQLNIYATYLQAKYKKPVYVWYDVMETSPGTKPKLVKKQRETLEEFEERLTAIYKDREQNKYIRKLIPILENLRRERMIEILDLAKAAQRYGYIGEPTKNRQSCDKYGGCPFFESCLNLEVLHESPRFEKKEHFKPKDTNEIPF